MALNNLQKADILLNKETTPNQIRQNVNNKMTCHEIEHAWQENDERRQFADLTNESLIQWYQFEFHDDMTTSL